MAQRGCAGSLLALTKGVSARPARLQAFDYLGFYRYFLTFCTVDRRPVFVDAGTVREVIEQIRRTCAEEQFAVLAYCFMPDHVHLLLEGRREDADLRRCAKLARQRSAMFYARLGGRRLWQAGFYDRVLRNEESTVDVVKYIVGNAVRGGLVARVVDYPFCGSDVCDLRVLWPD